MEATSDRFVETLISHCAATLAGQKPGSLFCWRSEDKDLFCRLVALKAELKPRGIHIRLLCRCDGAYQVYVHRPEQLRRLLARPDIMVFLWEQGYENLLDVEAVLSQLAWRFQHQKQFPHELGLFLGYPLADVRGFMENKGKNYLINGLWKVYDKEEACRQRFALYRRIREVYLHCYRMGISISRLTVAA